MLLALTSGAGIAEAHAESPNNGSGPKTVAYVPELGRNSVEVIDVGTRTSVARVPTAVRGPAFAYPTPGQRKVYVVAATDFGVSVIDSVTHQLIKSIPIAGLPEAGTYSPDGRYFYLADVGASAGGVTTIDTRTDTVVGGHINIPGAADVGVGPDGRYLYVSTIQGTFVTYDLTARTQVGQALPTGLGPVWLDVSPDGTRAYTVNFGTSDVTIIDLRRRRVAATVDVPSFPLTGALKPDGSQYWVPANNGNNVYVIDTRTDRVVQTIRTATPVGGMGFTPNGRQAWIGEATASSAADSIHALSQMTTTFLTSYTVDRGLLFDGPGQIAVYDTTTLRPVGSPIPVADEPFQVRFVTTL
jgi:YVTN family beta-propeller protein